MNTFNLPPVTAPLSLVAPAAPAPKLVPLPRPHAANKNGARDAEALARKRAVENLYSADRKSLRQTARRLVDSAEDAHEIVQEAFAILLASPTRAVTHATAWCIVRDLARDRRAERAQTDSYFEGDVEIRNEKAAWLAGVLGG